MFKKIVTELLYSPALAGNLGVYIKRVRDEKTKRQIGLVFVALAVVVQLFASLFPPESANANNPSVLIDGGTQSIDEYLAHYDQNTENIKDLLSALKISRTDIENTTEKPLAVTTEPYLWSMQNNRQADTAAYFFRTAGGKSEVAYYRPFDQKDSELAAFVGSSPSLGGWFAVMKGSGSLVTENPPSVECATPTTPENPLVVGSLNSSACFSSVELSLSARSISSTSPAPLQTAHASDRLAYTLSIKNTGDERLFVVPTINLEDTLEYSRILDNGGGEYNFDTRTLRWPTVALDGGKTLERSFIVQLLPTIPSTARGEHVLASYDCLMSTSFGNTLETPVACPFAKHVENTTRHLPPLSATANLIAASLLLIVSIYLYVRAKQSLTELYIIRHIHLGGS